MILYQHYNLMTHSATPFSLTRPLVFHVEILQAATPPQRDTPPWTGTLPPLSGSLASLNARLNLTWNQRDTAGQQVPPGNYALSLALPLPTAHYRRNGRPGQEQLPSGHMGQTDAQLATISR